MQKKISQLLISLEKTNKIFWNISRETGQFLNLLVKELRCKKILEIGTSNGYSGIWLAEALSHSGGHLYTMESHAKGRHALGRETFKKSGLNKYITHLLGHAPEAIPAHPKIFDLIFLDATKEEYVKHFTALKNRVKKNGILIADNLHSHKEALKDFIKAIKSEPSWKVTELNLGTGLLVGVKSQAHYHSKTPSPPSSPFPYG